MVRRHLVIGIAGTAILAAAVAMFVNNPASAPPRSGVSVLPLDQPNGSATVTSNLPVNAAADVRLSGIALEMELRILRDAGDPGAKLYGVKLAGDRQQIACGEIMATNTGKYARFIWLGDAGKVIAEDGRSLYTQFAPMCDGKGLP